MKTYEMVCEYLNKCPGNQMRDTDIKEIEAEDLDAYVQNLHKGKKMSMDKEVLKNGALVYHLDLSGTLIRYTFTEV